MKPGDSMEDLEAVIGRENDPDALEALIALRV